MFKLTAVSIIAHGHRRTWFLMLPFVNGKATISDSLRDRLLREMSVVAGDRIAMF